MATDETQTVKEQFDAAVSCGDVSQLGPPASSPSRALTGKHTVANGCGYRDWRVYKLGIMATNEWILRCFHCGLCYAVQTEAKKEVKTS